MESWSHFYLQCGIDELEKRVRKIRNLAVDANDPAVLEQIKAINHTIRFIEYNMSESDIDGGNGDEY